MGAWLRLLSGRLCSGLASRRAPGWGGPSGAVQPASAPRGLLPFAIHLRFGMLLRPVLAAAWPGGRLALLGPAARRRDPTSDRVCQERWRPRVRTGSGSGLAVNAAAAAACAPAFCIWSAAERPDISQLYEPLHCGRAGSPRARAAAGKRAGW